MAGSRLAVDAADNRWLDAAAALAAHGVPMSRPNPSVGALFVRDGIVLARGFTRQGGRPHAEACALDLLGGNADGATLYVSLEPCAHQSGRGPACADLLAQSGLRRVVVGCSDPDPRTAGRGIERLLRAGIAVDVASSRSCRISLAGHLTRTRFDRPHVTLKLALSADGHLTPGPGKGQWLTGDIARAHVHAVRAKMDAIVVGSGTFRADEPRLDVRLPGLEDRSPERWLLTRQAVPNGWRALHDPHAIGAMSDAHYLMVEGGAQTARAFLTTGLVDRLMLYRAPLTVGGDGPALPELTAQALSASGEWRLDDTRTLGNDTLAVYEHSRCLLV
ncbi:bifunctional diaminohydroxyphosphoribosylaminopyrimidine deaminase/5-amino-6-(5-phosphoribosylamino)uracil reductase RibD [Novosphingobium sp.]|uniref:bifunctional diaminohydroxyphosphoribosylaminopyrimidine deaminase/5-amino-6-(5-phosphoribosylamino)uracil reductase RibD n=1 Tax=Novosphingobium sp. TaxID=1874826 RepID=UPI0025E9748C|nr:bifunctional diaminohydroxyphosphoribosylaminopyrimidine deaminase/5-amino-6-(5-phosphoribosylamino)uracil reductase RibD [Novosphingobium sp.]